MKSWLVLLPFASGLFYDEIGKFDWHLNLCGIPQNLHYQHRLVVQTDSYFCGISKDGNLTWRRPFQGKVAQDKFLVIADQTVKVLDPVTGALEWEQVLQESAKAVFTFQDKIYVQTSSLQLFINGSQVWDKPLKVEQLVDNSLLTKHEWIHLDTLQRIPVKYDKALVIRDNVITELNGSIQYRSLKNQQEFKGNLIPFNKGPFWIRFDDKFYLMKFNKLLATFDELPLLSVSGDFVAACSSTCQIFNDDLVWEKTFEKKPIKFAFEVRNKVYATFLLSDGSLFSLQGWERPEYLGSLLPSQQGGLLMIDLPDKHLLSKHHDELDETMEQSMEMSPFERYLKRWKLHLKFNTKQQQISHLLERDKFGIKKLLLMTSQNGVVSAKLYPSGEDVWKRQLTGNPVYSFELRSVAQEYPSLVQIIATNMNSTLVYTLNSFTGEDYEENEMNVKQEGLMNALNNGLMNQQPNGFSKGLMNQLLTNFTENDRFYLVENSSIVGYDHHLNKVWSFSVPEFDTISVVKQQCHQVASLGRVLANRSVLYKFLNPNLMMVLGQKEDLIGVYLLDSFTGKLMHHTKLKGSNPQAIMCENWMVVTYYQLGYRALVMELFEHSQPDKRQKTELPFQIIPFVESRTFVLPFKVESLGVTLTKNGITTREILMALQSEQLFAVSRRLLDARRPYLDEEQLIPYHPLIDLNPKEIPSYSLRIKAKNIVSKPTDLESTSLVCGYGVDLFCTLRSPSQQFDLLSDGFSRVGLVTTIGLVLIGIYVAQQAAMRKVLAEQWK